VKKNMERRKKTQHSRIEKKEGKKKECVI